MSRIWAAVSCGILVIGWSFADLVVRQDGSPSVSVPTTGGGENASWTTPPTLLAADRDSRAEATVPEEDGASWGDLRGRFLYEGDVPVPELLTLNKDIDICSKVPPRSEALIVDADSKGIANVVIWLDLKRNQKVPTHESYAKTATAEIPFDNSKCRFEPHVCVLRTTQTLVVGNDDPVAHSAAFFMNRNDPFSALVQSDKHLEKQFPLTETTPSAVSCPIHAWMKGWLVVKDHPYVAVTDEKGNFKISNLPAGDWTFRVWHELPNFVTRVQQDGSIAEWEKGRVSVSIKPGKNDLGTVTLDAATFE